LLVTLLKTLNIFNTKNLQITHCKYSQFKIDMKKKIKEINVNMKPLLKPQRILSNVENVNQINVLIINYRPDQLMSQ
jgi:hypothetical protein